MIDDVLIVTKPLYVSYIQVDYLGYNMDQIPYLTRKLPDRSYYFTAHNASQLAESTCPYYYRRLYTTTQLSEPHTTDCELLWPHSLFLAMDDLSLLDALLCGCRTFTVKLVSKKYAEDRPIRPFTQVVIPHKHALGLQTLEGMSDYKELLDL